MEIPMLTTPDLKETLYIYLVASREAVERDYAPLEKLALCLLHLSRILRRYFEDHPIKVITDQPIKQILNKPKAFRKVAKYEVELGAYNITYIPRNTVKGQVLADLLNEVPVGTKHLEICSLTDDENPEEWTLFTDSASSLKGAGVGLVLIDPAGTEYTYAIRLNFASTNNEAEYEALLAGLRIARKMKVQSLKVKVDSKLELSALFTKFSIENVPRNQNQKADVLRKLASVAFNHLTKEILVEVLDTKLVEAREMNTIVEEEEDNYMTPIIRCLEEGIWLEDENESRALRMKISQYMMEEEVLFKKSYMSPMLRCVGLLQANYIIRGVHEGACGMHAGARSVVAKITRHGYYWPSMHQDTKEVWVAEANGLVERASKSLIHGLKARLGRERVGWVDELPNILWDHQTMLKTSNRETPFSFTDGSEAVILAKIGMPTYQTLQWNEAQNKEEMRLNLDLVQERRETAAIQEAK
ncbi:reverse transcriptase domain-containing protein [Tanacetum coccineum]